MKLQGASPSPCLPSISASLGELRSPECKPGSQAQHTPGMVKMGSKQEDQCFPPPGYRPTPINKLLVNALDLTAPASDALLKNRKNAWVQLAGHPGSFAPAGPHTIWKKRLTKENNETVVYRALMNDVIKDVIPKFYREVEYNGDIFIEIEDLLQHFTNPAIMDIKIGTRTFMEAEVKNAVLRKDLYEKMIKLSPHEPTPEEHAQKAITKLRYMQFRENETTTLSLGFRVEAVRMPGDHVNDNLKKINTREGVEKVMARFLEYNPEVLKKLTKRLRDIRRRFSSSQFFKDHEIVGSSILVLYDHQRHAGAWMIDFAKTSSVEDSTLNHRTPWTVGNHEDGYLLGLDNLIKVCDEMDLSKRQAEAAARMPTLGTSGSDTGRVPDKCPVIDLIDPKNPSQNLNQNQSQNHVQLQCETT